MTKPRSVACLGVLSLPLLFACSAGVKPTVPDGGGGSGPGNGGTTGTGGRSGTNGFDASFDFMPNNDTPGDGVCAAIPTKAEPVPLDLYVMVDVSRSMALSLPAPATATKWDAVRSAMNTFFADPQSTGLGVGLGYFPVTQPNIPANCTTDMACGTFGPCDRRRTCVATGGMTTVVTPLCSNNTQCAAGQTCALIQDCGASNYCAADAPATCPANCSVYAGYCHARDICNPQTYATPAVPIAALAGSAGQAATLMASLTARAPDGYTPTAPALRGAIQYARQYAQANPSHRLAVVLVTDGLPLSYTDFFETLTGIITPGLPRPECDPTDIPGIAQIASAGATASAGMPAIPTFVIGVFSSDEMNVIGPMLNQIATSGGTAPAVLINTGQDVSQVLRTKLNEIRTKAIACDFALPTGGVDFKKVNVQFTTGSNMIQILHAPDGGNGSGCTASGGWYYDRDPATGTPTKITACPATCAMFQTDLNGRVDVLLGCPTIDVG